MKIQNAFRLAVTLAALLVSQNAAAEPPARPLPHGATAAELQALRETPAWNAPRVYSAAPPAWQPAVDTADFKYVLLSSEAGFSEAANLRYTIARHLPEGVKLVLLVTPGSVEQVRRNYAPYISMDRVIFASANNMANGFWARDAFPVPVTDAQGRLSLVNAKYYRNFTAGDALARAVGAPIAPQDFTFVGGNLLADENGVCFVVDSYRRFNSTDEDMAQAYGCKALHVMPHAAGLGDVDEVLKPLGGGRMLTNEPSYVANLEAWGYQVVMMPKIPRGYRTYINSLVVGKTVFMPTYGVSTDTDAQKVYEGLGFQVVGIPSNTLSDQMHGSIHCQSMAYPALSEEALLRGLNLTRANH